MPLWIPVLDKGILRLRTINSLFFVASESIGITKKTSDGIQNMTDFANIPWIYFCHFVPFDLFACSVLELKFNGRCRLTESYLSESGKPPSKTEEILVLKSPGDFGQGRQEGQEWTNLPWCKLRHCYFWIKLNIDTSYCLIPRLDTVPLFNQKHYYSHNNIIVSYNNMSHD